MSKQTDTAGKNAEAAQEPITYTQIDGKITVTITGAAFANIQAVADAMNATSWCDHDNTALDVFEWWCGSFIDRTADKPSAKDPETIEDMATDILDGIDTGEDEGSEADKVKKDELEAQFVAHGVLRSEGQKDADRAARAHDTIEAMDSKMQSDLRRLAAEQNISPVE